MTKLDIVNRSNNDMLINSFTFNPEDYQLRLNYKTEGTQLEVIRTISQDQLVSSNTFVSGMYTVLTEAAKTATLAIIIYIEDEEFQKFEIGQLGYFLGIMPGDDMLKEECIFYGKEAEDLIITEES